MWTKRILLAVVAFASATVHAQDFAVGVSPPRFELSAKPGERLRQVVEISNASAQTTSLQVRTADWRLEPDYGVTFFDELTAGSCRPWVAIERREILVPGAGRYRFRFEVSAPADAPVGECRFALLFEGGDQQVKSPGGVSFPVAGRIGVIVYVAVGGAAPRLEFLGTSVATIEGQRTPVLLVRNNGNAHGRLAGFLSGRDSRGRELDFTPSTFPILPGESRQISLKATLGRDEVTEIAYPVTIRGTLEWSDQRVPFEQRFE